MHDPIQVKKVFIIAVEKAYLDLSQEAFAMWIRFLGTSQEELCRGRSWLAKSMKLPLSSFNRYLKELSDKNYVKLSTVEKEHRTRVDMTYVAAFKDSSIFSKVSTR